MSRLLAVLLVVSVVVSSALGFNRLVLDQKLGEALPHLTLALAAIVIHISAERLIPEYQEVASEFRTGVAAARDWLDSGARKVLERFRK